MSCCPPSFIFLSNGIDILEDNIQADGKLRVFVPYKQIVDVRYNYTRGDGGTLTLVVNKNSYTYLFPCDDSGMKVYTQILEKIPA
jgi:hypothetical protein